jgi:CRP/FNR family cyclic AMP-dependent transcriptional regulator
MITVSTEPPVDTTHTISLLRRMILRSFADPRGGFVGGIMSSNRIKSKKQSKKKPAFDVQAFLDSAGVARKIVAYGKSQKIYSQGEPAQNVMYIQNGGIQLSVVNEVGKEAVVAILAPGDFFGEGCLAAQSVRMGTATAIAPTTVLVIEKKEMIRLHHAEHAFSGRSFLTCSLRASVMEEFETDEA